MFWILMAILVVMGAALVLRRRRQYETPRQEPWRSSLAKDEPLDLEEIRRAEDEWLQEDAWEDLPEDESWR